MTSILSANILKNIIKEAIFVTDGTVCEAKYSDYDVGFIAKYDTITETTTINVTENNINVTLNVSDIDMVQDAMVQFYMDSKVDEHSAEDLYWDNNGTPPEVHGVIDAPALGA